MFCNIRKYLFEIVLFCLLASCNSSYNKYNKNNNISPSLNDKLKESFITSCVSKAEGIFGENYCSCTYDRFVEKYGIREFIHYFALIGQGKAQLKPEDEEIIRECLLTDFELNEPNEKGEPSEKGEPNEINEPNKIIDIDKEKIDEKKDIDENNINTAKK